MKKHLERVAKKLDEIPEEKIAVVPKEIAVPLLQKLSYTTNEQVAELYVNLLTSAANENTASNAHPAFVQMVERLSADEAKIIDFIKDIDELNYLHLQVDYGPPKFKQAYLLKYVSELDELNLDFPKNITAYLSNLVSMGILIDIKINYLKHQQYVFNKLREKYKLKFEESEIELKRTHPNSSLVWIQSYFEVTPFGYLFICACTGAIYSEIRVIIDNDDFILD
ncbi:DUF4393 domain-containing protein [Spirosoma arboris]|uniref:DUF4393 domain-containing protein n=1 Tax=Spirosoma arboris TaxID=2682092 RepID=UPI0012F919E7|nr:DUF4393 domain-containing protein [Spirosoma arboris]